MADTGHWTFSRLSTSTAATNPIDYCNSCLMPAPIRAHYKYLYIVLAFQTSHLLSMADWLFLASSKPCQDAEILLTNSFQTANSRSCFLCWLGRYPRNVKCMTLQKQRVFKTIQQLLLCFKRHCTTCGTCASSCQETRFRLLYNNLID
jgi:hypothetical protein